MKVHVAFISKGEGLSPCTDRSRFLALYSGLPAANAVANGGAYTYLLLCTISLNRGSPAFNPTSKVEFIV